MSQHARRAGVVARSLVAAVRSENLTFVAASLAYYAFVSLLPLLLLSLVAVSVLAGPDGSAQVTDRVQTLLGPVAGEQVHTALTGGGRGGATIVGIVVLLWSGLKVFRGLDIAFSQMYGGDVADSLPQQLVDAAVVLPAVGAGVLLTVGVSVFVSRTPLDVRIAGVDLVGVAAAIGLVVALTGTLLPLYYFFPDRDLRLVEAIPGAAFAAVGWTLLQIGFRVYAATVGSFDAYGVIGGGLLLATFLYFGGIVLLLGAVLNAVLADPDRTGDRHGLAPFPPHDVSSMTDDDQAGSPGIGEEPDDQALAEEIEALRAEIDDRTVHREEIERDLKRYVRRRVRRGYARDWGPYLVLGYGTLMTIGAFYFLQGWWAILAMFVVWTSTLGVYVLMLLVGAGLTLAGVPGRLLEFVRDRR